MSSFKHIHMSCREDIFSADQAVEAVATLLHEVAPDGDVGAAADALRQVNIMLCANVCVPCCSAQETRSGSVI